MLKPNAMKKRSIKKAMFVRLEDGGIFKDKQSFQGGDH